MENTIELIHELSNSQYNWLSQLQPGEQLLGNRMYRWAKRIMDLSLLLLSAPIVLPLLVFIVIAVKLETPCAPVFFKQERTGKGGNRFKMIKFRTMVVNAERLKVKLAHLNELQWPDFKITNDPRITRIGKILRKTSLDELPQLYNVLIGDMSLVGPRPTSFKAETYQLWQTERLDVIPGITGLWQLYGRGETEFADRLKMDIAYIERRCLWLDFQILYRTIFAIIQRRGAK